MHICREKVTGGPQWLSSSNKSIITPRNWHAPHVFLLDPTLWPAGSYLGISIRELVVNRTGYARNARGGGPAYSLGWDIPRLDKLKRRKFKPQCKLFPTAFPCEKKSRPQITPL